jgi:acyl-CoA synthetase (AMP-forming)/AMP-acid ligase II
MGEELGAFIKLKDKSKPLRREDLREFCKGKISHFKVPRYVFNVERDFPKTSTGKVHKIKFPEYFKDEIKAGVSQE